MDRIERARRDADELERVHEQISALNELGAYTDLLDHVARKCRINRETAKTAARSNDRR